MSVIVDEVMLREPNLLISGKKPVGPVKIDRNHSLTDGLISNWILQGGNPRDIASNKDAIYYGVMNKVYTSGGGRFCPSTTDSSSALEVPATVLTDIYLTSGMTAIVMFDIHTMNTNTVGLLNRYVGSPSSDRSWLLGLTPAGLLIGAFSTDGSYQGANDVNGSTTLVTNKIYSVAMTWQPGTARVYLNGIQDGVNTSSASSLYDSNAPLYIGGPQYYNRGFVGSYAQYLFGTVYSASFYNRALSADEIKSLYLDPYQFLIPS